MAGTGDIKHVKIILLDDPVQMHIDEVLARRSTPMPNHEGLHMSQRQRHAQKRIIVEINLPDRQVVGGAPVGVILCSSSESSVLCPAGVLTIPVSTSRCER